MSPWTFFLDHRAEILEATLNHLTLVGIVEGLGQLCHQFGSPAKGQRLLFGQLVEHVGQGPTMYQGQRYDDKRGRCPARSAQCTASYALRASSAGCDFQVMQSECGEP